MTNGTMDDMLPEAEQSLTMSSTPILKGTATGSLKHVKEFGISVPRFKEKMNGKVRTVQYHVPLEFRGDYRPSELANYSPATTYRTDAYGKALCDAVAKSSGLTCNRRAINRTTFCGAHGGALHPLDAVVREDKDVSELSRFEQFRRGIIDVSDLDDEELATSSFRAKDGRLYQPKNLPSTIVNEFTKALYARATSEMQKNAVEAVTVTAEIMKSTAVDPEVRLNAAKFIIERNMGKTPTQVNVSVDAPWEQIFEGIAHERPNGPESITSGAIDAEFTDITESGEGADLGKEENPLDFMESFDGRSLHSIDQPTTAQRLGIPYAHIPEPEISVKESGSNRNPAVMAKEQVVDDFEYDFSTPADEINKARRKRFVARNLGLNAVEELDIWHPLTRKEEFHDNNGLRIIFNSPSY